MRLPEAPRSAKRHQETPKRPPEKKTQKPTFENTSKNVGFKGSNDFLAITEIAHHDGVMGF